MSNSELEQVNEIDKDANIDPDSVVITSENGKKQAVDFIDFIQTSNEVSAVKIRNLRQYISDEELLTIYQDRAGTITSEEELGNYLEEIFFSAANYINDLANGIVINLDTGLKDEDKSFEKAIQYGIYSEDSFVDTSNESIKNTLEQIGIISTHNEKIDYMLEHFETSRMTFGTLTDGVDLFLSKAIEEMNLSIELKNLASEYKEIMEKSPYKKDKHLFEISQLYVMLDDAKNTPRYNAILAQIQNFYAKYPEYEDRKDEIPVLNSDGTINKNEKNNFKKYGEIYQDVVIMEHFDMVNGKTTEELSKIDLKEKRHAILCAFAGLKYENIDDEKRRAISTESRKIIDKLYPNLDLNNEKELAEFFKNEMGFEGKVDTITFEELVEFSFHRVRISTDEDIINNTTKDGIDFSEIDFDVNSRRYLENPMENYFFGSKIQFTENDEKQYNEDYQNYTIDAWIESKDAAMKLRYKALQEVLKDYKKAQSNPYIEGKIVEIENAIVEFEKEHADKDLTLDEDFSFEAYREDFVNAGLTKFLTRDALEWEMGKNYKDLDPKHKRAYMRNILVCLDGIKEDEKNGFYSPISKLILRRLELMNSEGKEFITFDDNGDFEINEEILFEEYVELSPYKYRNFEELKHSAMLRKNEYLLKKLDEYTKLPESELLNFHGETDPDIIMSMIEDKRVASNQKRIDKIIQDSKVKKDKELIENSPFQKDINLYELCKLHKELRDQKNVENTQMYSIKLAQIKEFYKKHPRFRNATIPILNEDGTLNEDEIEKMDQYSEAYQRIIIVKHLDKFNGKSPKDIAEMPKNDRQNVLLCALAGLKYRDSQDEEIRKVSMDCMNLIKKEYPYLDLDNDEALAEFFINEIGFNGKIKSLSLDELVKITSLQLKEATEKYIGEYDENDSNREIDISSFDLESSKRKVYNSVMKNYFVGSEIEFNEEDEDKYNMMYQLFTVSSWIENKDNAIKLRYIALNTIRDEYKNAPNNSYIKEKLEDIEKNIVKFEKQYGKIDLTENENDVHFNVYRQHFVNAGLTKYLTRDSSEWSDGINYAELDDNHKKIYIRNTLVALEHLKDSDFCMTKIGLRRLELMNSKGKDFFKVNQDGQYEINKELILEEYNRMSSHEYSTYEELAQSATLRKNEYLLKKLEEYTNLDAKAFVSLDKRDDYKRTMEQIENARYKSNQKRIHEMLQQDANAEEKEKTESVRKKKTRKVTEKKSHLHKENDSNSKLETGKSIKESVQPTSKTRNVSDSQPVKELQSTSRVEPVNNIQPAMSAQIKDADFEDILKVGQVEVVKIDIASKEPPKELRETREKDQEEVYDYINDVNSEFRSAGIDVAQIDDSAIEEGTNERNTEKTGIIDRIKSAFNSVKNFISKHINKKEKVKMLEEGKTTLSNSATGDAKKATERNDFNSSLVVDLSLQEQQDYSKKQQIQNAIEEDKKIDESDGR